MITLAESVLWVALIVFGLAVYAWRCALKESAAARAERAKLQGIADEINVKGRAMSEGAALFALGDHVEAQMVWKEAGFHVAPVPRGFAVSYPVTTVERKAGV